MQGTRMATMEDYEKIRDAQAELIKRMTLENDDLRGEIFKLKARVNQLIRIIKAVANE